ncbi:RNA polymerase-binding protein DksA [Campylobacter sp. FMV-PI01]|uniref:RNA polymerase-binding protein DksA n=1 Tax=Campylobacter portucalensis TaxID=2608384 RepID=A0A6L5WLG7_9BACT|nr:RNA polymerase-binding protein DksA [Campylobacter portucalensis]MSN96653.1 RNA polymerase-binding protein DksA [Campylobacter portucalensis]
MKKSDLDYFKKILIDKKEQIIKNINYCSRDLKELMHSATSDELDAASINTDTNLEYCIATQQQKELQDIEISLEKINNNSYGICEMCEDDIDIARLKAKPNAKFCIICKEISEKNR